MNNKIIREMKAEGMRKFKEAYETAAEEGRIKRYKIKLNIERFGKETIINEQ